MEYNYSMKRNPLSMSPMTSFSREKNSLSITTAGLKRKREKALLRKLKQLNEDSNYDGAIRSSFSSGDPFRKRKNDLESQLQDVRSSSLPSGEMTLYVSMSSRMYGVETQLLKENEGSREKRKTSFWPPWARVSGTGRLRTVTLPAEMLEEMTDFVEGYGCTWQEE